MILSQYLVPISSIAFFICLITTLLIFPTNYFFLRNIFVMTEGCKDFNILVIILSFGYITFRSSALRIECCFEKSVLIVFLFKRHTSTFTKINSLGNTTASSRKHFLHFFCLKFYKKDMTNKTQ